VIWQALDGKGTLRVASEIVAYQNYARRGIEYSVGSALIELKAVALFAINLITAFTRSPML
jgi:hypothetical protein